MGEMKSYTFTASAGDTVYTRMVSSWQQDPQIQLFAPNGSRIAEANGLSWMNSNTSHLDSTGTYTLVVGDGHIGSVTGTYGLFLQRTNNSGNAPPIAFGETKNGAISTMGEMKSYTFSAWRGDRIYIHMTSSGSSIPRFSYSPRMDPELQKQMVCPGRTVTRVTLIQQVPTLSSLGMVISVQITVPTD